MVKSYQVLGTKTNTHTREGLSEKTRSWLWRGREQASRPQGRTVCHQLKIKDRAAHTKTGQGGVNSENGKCSGQDKVKDKGKTEGNQSRNGWLEGDGRLLNLVERSDGKPRGSFVGNKAVVVKLVNEETKKGQRGPRGSLETMMTDL